jgi:hypothetical protein
MGDAAVVCVEWTSNTINSIHNHFHKKRPCDHIWEYYLMPEASDMVKKPFKDCFKVVV